MAGIMSILLLRLPRPARFALVGVMNSLITLGLIGLLLALRANPYAANLIGYLCGFANSYIMNRRFTFRTHGRASLAETARFAVYLGVAYGANLAIIAAGQRLGVPAFLAQAAAMVIYTCVFYALSSKLVFTGTGR